LIAWVAMVGTAPVRERADAAARPLPEQVLDAERQRCLRWWFHDDGTRFGIEGDLPASEGP
jgi:hypothetical protein